MMLTGTKRNVHNIVDNHISTERRTGRDLRDAYYHRSKYLLKKAQELQSITGCIVHLEITPTWEKGVKNVITRKVMSLILIRQLSQANHILTHQQMMLLTKHQRKKGNLKRKNLQISILQMFAGYVVLCGNLFRMRKVTHSG